VTQEDKGLPYNYHAEVMVNRNQSKETALEYFYEIK